MSEQKKIITPWADATIINSLLFRFLMEREDLCKGFLERALDIKIKSLSLPTEENERCFRDTKNTALAVDVVDADGNKIDVGMRTLDAPADTIGNYARNYMMVMSQARIACGTYLAAEKSYMIYLCPFDPFTKNDSKYELGSYCKESDEWLGCRDVFLNASGDRAGITPELANFLDFVAGKPVEDDFVAELTKAIADIKQDAALQAKYERLIVDAI